MGLENGLTTMLELIDRPAFLVREGIIAAVNQAASALLIPANVPVLPLISAGSQEYLNFAGGTLYLRLTVEENEWEASVSIADNCHLFVVRCSSGQELQALALAAIQLRGPLSDALAISEHLSGETVSADQIAGINRSLYQILRTVGNMSDAANGSISRMELQDAPSVISEIFAASRDYCEAVGVTLEFQNQVPGICMLLDAQKIERGIYNILSNSLKFTPAGGWIRAKLTCRSNMLYLSVADSGAGISRQPPGTVFDQYLRPPRLEDSRHGLGLGFSILRNAAAAHGGTVLIEQPKGAGLHITLGMPIRQECTGLRSPRISIDYTGERSHALVELSDALPTEFYRPDKL